MKLGTKDLIFWYKIYKRQSTETQIVNEYYSDGKKKPPLSARDLKKRVEKRLKEFEEELVD